MLSPFVDCGRGSTSSANREVRSRPQPNAVPESLFEVSVSPAAMSLARVDVTVRILICFDRVWRFRYLAFRR